MKINNLGMYRDVEGETYEIIEEVTQTVSQPLSGSTTTYDGSKGYRTSCGIPVNVRNDVFVTCDGIVLTPTD